MPCFHPINSVNAGVNPITGKKVMWFLKRGAALHGFESLKVPCGQCDGCRVDRSRDWAIRAIKESHLYKDNCFITLTFGSCCPLMLKRGRGYKRLPDSKLVNPSFSLHKFHFEDFMKRLRKRYVPVCPFDSKTQPDLWAEWMRKHQIRFLHCGEYGEKFRRPHHHALLFNFDFPDKYLWKREGDVRLYRSKSLEELWPFGHSSVGALTVESAAYVARYVLKKINGDMAPAHYDGRLPEYISMSLKPGVAKNWFDKFKKTDVYPQDFIVEGGKKFKVPKYFNRCYELTNPDEYGILRDKRVEAAKASPDNTPERLAAREKVLKANLKLVDRPLED